MRVPEQTPDSRELLETRQDDALRALQNPEYAAFAARMNRRHRHWNKVKFIARAEGLDPELAWIQIKLGRQYRFTPFRGPDGSVVHYSIPDDLSRELMMLDQETAGRIASDSDVRIPAGSQRERFIIRALMEEAIASSMLEGAATTRQDAKQMIRSGREPVSSGERMVLNNYKTMLFIREHSDTPMSPEFLLELQRMLTVDTLDKPDQAGRFRTAADVVRVEDVFGNTVYTPPRADELPNRLETLCRFANQPNDDPHFIHPIVRACLLHFQVAVDHPFCDGNGRTARAVFYWYVLRNKYWLFEFMPISTLIRVSPSKYALSYLYAETDSYDATYFLMYNAQIFRRARKSMNDYIRRKLHEQRRAASILNADPDLNLRQRQVLLRFARDNDRQATIDSHAAEYQISYQTARNDLLDLVKRDYLAHYKAGKTYMFTRGRRLVEVAS